MSIVSIERELNMIARFDPKFKPKVKIHYHQTAAHKAADKAGFYHHKMRVAKQEGNNASYHQNAALIIITNCFF